MNKNIGYMQPVNRDREILFVSFEPNEDALKCFFVEPEEGELGLK